MLYRTLLIMLCGLLTYGCNRQRPQPVPERRVKVTTVLRPDFIDKDFAGMSTADNAANLAFKVGGQIERIDVSEGTSVPKGFLIARLDPKEYELQRDAARSAFQTAQSQFERAQRLLSHEAISRAEYESAQTAYIRQYGRHPSPDQAHGTVRRNHREEVRRSLPACAGRGEHRAAG